MADKLKVKIEKVPVQILTKGEPSWANLDLTEHHIILTLTATSSPTSADDTKNHRPRSKPQTWIAYPMIAFCTFRPTPPGSEYSSSIRLRGRDFRFITLNIKDSQQARDVFESIRAATCRLGGIEKLFAFSYNPPPPEKAINGWEIYDPKAEWRRQGISDKGVDKGWRMSKINVDYLFSPTYPALLPVPSSISDNTLNYAGKYRSRVRIPVLTYLHPVNNCSITRSSQPMAGLRGNRSIQDEKLVSACFSACAQPDEAEKAPTSNASAASSQTDLTLPSVEGELTDTERLEDEMISSSSIEIVTERPHIYGAQQHNLIVDARPTVNAMAMQAVGLGSENMDHYKFATKAYLGIDNIHVMRDSLAKVIDAIKDSDITKSPPNKDILVKSGWLKHITGLLDGSALIARQVGIQHSHVLIHCSDGWDRTSQLSALSQLLLDPYYRTIEGFIVLVEKDWLAFGHMFQHRSGFLNSEKWFAVQNDAMAGSAIQPGGNSEGRGDALENALMGAKRFFQRSNPPPDVADSDGDVVDEAPKGKGKDTKAEREATKPKETSPVFHQFLDATYQLLYQFPTRFEFNEKFLYRLLYHLYSCQYGTFLYNNEKSRLDVKLQQRTSSVWSHFLARKSDFINPEYDATINDHVIGKERLLFPRLNEVRWWNNAFGRTDVEMNGHPRKKMELDTPLLKTPESNKSEKEAKSKKETLVEKEKITKSEHEAGVDAEEQLMDKKKIIEPSESASEKFESSPTASDPRSDPNYDPLGVWNGAQDNSAIQPVLTGVENAHTKHNTPSTFSSNSPRQVSDGNKQTGALAQLRDSMAGLGGLSGSLGLGKASAAGGVGGAKSPGGKQPMEVEMQ